MIVHPLGGGPGSLWETEAMSTLTDTEIGAVEAALDALLAAHDPKKMDNITFRGHRFDFGLAWVHFPVGHGGLGVRPELNKIVEERLRKAGAQPQDPSTFFIALAGPTIVTHGSEDAKKRFLRPMFTGEERWCQLFSEPGAGSDFAGLGTKAVRDGDEWVVNGQKVWNTLAHLGDWGMLVTRTDPDQPKHKGMTYFAIDMHSAGVEVRPLRQITGEAEFNEVYMTDARVPDSQRIGEVGEGWRVALTTLMNERTAIGGGGGGTARRRGPIDEAVRIFRENGLERQRLEQQRDADWLARDLLARMTQRLQGCESVSDLFDVVRLQGSTVSKGACFHVCRVIHGAGWGFRLCNGLAIAGNYRDVLGVEDDVIVSPGPSVSRISVEILDATLSR